MPRRQQHRRPPRKASDPSTVLPPRPKPTPPPQKDYFLELTERLERAARIKAAYLEWKRKKQELFLLQARVKELAAENRRRSEAKLAVMRATRAIAAAAIEPKVLAPCGPIDPTAHPSWRSFSRRAQAYILAQGPLMEMPDRLQIEAACRAKN